MRLGRLPTVVGDILRELDTAGVSKDLKVVSTHAIFAYEALAGVQCRMELLVDPHKKLALASRKLDGAGLMGLLRQIDKTFEQVRAGSFRATNRAGFMVDLIMPEPSLLETETISQGATTEDLAAVDVPNLHWLTNAPTVDAVAIAANGMPVLMNVPDPRAFAIHKAWLSGQPDREEVKRQRDLQQAELVLAMLETYLPTFPIDPRQLRFFPVEIVERAIGERSPSSVRLPDMGF